MISAETYNADYEKAVKFGYNKGIDEFAEKLSNDVEFFNATIYGEKATVLTLDYFMELVWDTAEQLKGE